MKIIEHTWKIEDVVANGIKIVLVKCIKEEESA